MRILITAFTTLSISCALLACPTTVPAQTGGRLNNQFGTTPKQQPQQAGAVGSSAGQFGSNQFESKQFNSGQFESSQLKPSKPSAFAPAAGPASGSRTFQSGGFTRPGRQQVGETSQRSSSGKTHQISECTVMLMPQSDIEVPALESGQLIKVNVKKGDSITAGTIIAQIDDSVPRRLREQAQFNLQIASDQAADNTEIKAAERKFQLANNEFKNQKRLLPKGSTSKKEYERAKYSMELAALEWDMAQNNKKRAAVEAQAEGVNLKGANDSIMRHAIASKFNGIVFDVKRQEGEWVTAGETVLHIGRMDKLHVGGRVQAKEYDPHEIKNRRVTIRVNMARNREIEFQGKIVFVDNQRMGSTAYQVIAEVDNRQEQGTWMLQPKSVATMNIHLDDIVGPIGSNQQPLLPSRR